MCINVQIQIVQDPSKPGDAAEGTMTLIFVFLGSMTLGTALAFSLRPQNSTYRTTQPGDLSVPLTGNGDIAKRMVALLYEKKMLLLILILVYTGLQQAFIWLVLFHYSLLTGTFSYASPTLEI